jgi:hypothetical protein
LLDLMTDGALADGELARRRREAPVVAHGLEGAQRAQIGQVSTMVPVCHRTMKKTNDWEYIFCIVAPPAQR